MTDLAAKLDALIAGATKGVWKVDPDPDCEHQNVLGPDGYMVADCAIFSLRKGAPSSERCTANARAIALTPLLAAVARDAAALQQAEVDYSTDSVAWIAARNALDASLAALAKEIDNG